MIFIWLRFFFSIRNIFVVYEIYRSSLYSLCLTPPTTLTNLRCSTIHFFFVFPYYSYNYYRMVFLIFNGISVLLSYFSGEILQLGASSPDEAAKWIQSFQEAAMKVLQLWLSLITELIIISAIVNVNVRICRVIQIQERTCWTVQRENGIHLGV